MKFRDQKFELRTILYTQEAFEALQKGQERPATYLARHASGDWGDVSQETWEENDLRINQRFSLYSEYELHDGTAILVITSPDRRETTFLLPREY